MNLSYIAKKARIENKQSIIEERKNLFPLPEGYDINSPDNIEIKKAYNALLNNIPVVFVTGAAGTGKSTFINYVRNNITKDSGKEYVILACYGSAALNINGQTIHSFFNFPARDFDSSEIHKFKKNTAAEKTDLIIIDEISIVESSLLDHIDYALRLWCNSNIPFAGKQLLLIGDYFQLSPWIRWDNEATKKFKSQWDSQFFFDAHVFNNVNTEVFKLTKVHRQNDINFINILNRIRTLDNGYEKDIEFLNTNCEVKSKLERNGRFHLPENCVYLTTTNEKADKVNNERLQKFSEETRQPIIEFTGTFEGKMTESKVERILTPKLLRICIGAKIMITRNIYFREHKGTPDVVNGSFGFIKEIASDNSFITVSLLNGKEIRLEKYSWDMISYEWNDEKNILESKIIGSFKQFPIRLGWALTIHKAQGMTLDCVDIDVQEAFAPGQAYVALSRCKSLEGLYLQKPIKLNNVKIDNIVKKFDELLFQNPCTEISAVGNTENVYRRKAKGLVADFEIQEAK